MGAIGGAAGSFSGNAGAGGAAGGNGFGGNGFGGNGFGGNGSGGSGARGGAGGNSGAGGLGAVPAQGGRAGAGGLVSMAGAAGSVALPLGCPANELGSSLGTTSGSIGSGYDNVAACSGAGPELVFHWRAPRTGSYRIDTLGSDFDTVLTVAREEPCAALQQPTQCNDDYAGQQSLLVVQGQEGNELFIVVDSWGPAGGEYVLNIREGEQCPQGDVSEVPAGQPFEYQGFAAAARSLPAGGVTACNGASVGLRLVFRAPVSGVFEFSTAGSDFDTVLAARESCDGASLGCNDDAPGESRSELQLRLDAGQSIVLEVSAFANALARPMDSLKLSFEIVTLL